MEFFQRTQKRVRNNGGKRAISVLLYVIKVKGRLTYTNADDNANDKSDEKAYHAKVQI